VPPADPEAVYPEYLAVGDPADRAAGHVIEWLRDPVALARARARVDAVAARVAHPGSAARAAVAVLAIAGGTAPVEAAVRQAA
jgi:glycerol kinase